MDSVFSSAFWFSSNTRTRWTEIDVFEIGGGAPGGPGPGHPYIMHTNMHIFRDAARGITPARPISKPRNTYHNRRLAGAYYTYAVDWDRGRIQWLFNGRVVRSERNDGHHQWLRLKLDSESFPYWFGLPGRSFRSSLYRVKYVRGWSKTARWRRSSGSRGDPPPQLAADAAAGGRVVGGRAAPAAAAAVAVTNGTFRADGDAAAVGADDADAASVSTTVDAATLGEDAGVSPWALQRVPSPDSPEVILRSPPVPAGGWVAAAGDAGGRVARRAGDWPPRELGADTFGTWNAGD